MICDRGNVESNYRLSLIGWRQAMKVGSIAEKSCADQISCS